ncbi:N-acetyltransferase [Plebeiibacterium sediminum]|uniref:N-acetyltransferase n=1 Tax=Plebeiibacterium sediminum TaxID=2992112 RepID=A0AAE3M6B1_9BACT|nr:N-acetyltransferase [Plebeiobacterium sediminum]MCW3787927.1 N-acetyltransferase [Plebeiobacterium sediminum]
MEIRELVSKDIDIVVDLWYETSIIAHDFIPGDYWKNNKGAMAFEYLPNSETYLAIENGEIVGFVAMIENFLAAIFVDNQFQGQGIGKSLLNFVKHKRTRIKLNVYEKNRKSIDFYKSQGFIIKAISEEEKTCENEFLMEWTR